MPAGIAVSLTDTRFLGLDPGYPLHFTVRADTSVAPGDCAVAIHSTVNDGTPTPVDTSATAVGTRATTFVVRVVAPSEDRGFVPHAFFGFEADGTYTLLVYTLMRGRYGCTTEVWSEYAGAVTFADETFETRPTWGRYKVADSCFGNFYSRVASSADLEANSRTWHWAWERNDTDGKTYLRIGFDRESREHWNWFARTDEPCARGFAAHPRVARCARA